jgi:hypothetical protein
MQVARGPLSLAASRSFPSRCRLSGLPEPRATSSPVPLARRCREGGAPLRALHRRQGVSTTKEARGNGSDICLDWIRCPHGEGVWRRQRSEQRWWWQQSSRTYAVGARRRPRHRDRRYDGGDRGGDLQGAGCMGLVLWEALRGARQQG